VTTSTELVASVEIAHEARTERIPPGAADGAVLRVIPGDDVRVAALLGRDPQLARALAFGALSGGASLVALVGTHDGRTFVERGAFLRDAQPDLIVALATDRRDADGLVELAEALRFGCAQQRPLPHILVSADEAIRDRIAASCPANTIEVTCARPGVVWARCHVRPASLLVRIVAPPTTRWRGFFGSTPIEVTSPPATRVTMWPPSTDRYSPAGPPSHIAFGWRGSAVTAVTGTRGS